MKLLFLMLLAIQIKAVPADLIPLKDADLLTIRPLVIAKEGIYVCPSGFDMYVRMAETHGQIVKVEPLKRARMIASKDHEISILCVSQD